MTSNYFYKNKQKVQKFYKLFRFFKFAETPKTIRKTEKSEKLKKPGDPEKLKTTYFSTNIFFPNNLNSPQNKINGFP